MAVRSGYVSLFNARYMDNRILYSSSLSTISCSSSPPQKIDLLEDVSKRAVFASFFSHSSKASMMPRIRSELRALAGGLRVDGTQMVLTIFVSTQLFLC